jgi:DNA-binding transcriptional LysR family regulator
VQILLDKWWNENFSVPPHIGMEVDKVDTCKEMVAKGLGYAFLPGMILSNDQDLQRCEMLYKSGNPLIRRTWMYHHKEAMDLKLVNVFFEFIQTVDFYSL